MSLDITIEVESIGSVDATFGGYKSRLKVELNSADLVDAVEPKIIVGEYGNEELLEVIGEEYVQKWLEEQGFTVTYGDAL